jgi:hypothetical protein
MDPSLNIRNYKKASRIHFTTTNCGSIRTNAFVVDNARQCVLLEL